MTKKESLASLIKSSDLKSVKHLIFLKNETSQTEVPDYRSFRLIELDEQYILLEAPPNCAREGHQLQIFFLPREVKQGFSKLPSLELFPDLIVVVGNVVEFNLNKEKTKALLKITFTQFKTEDWDKIKEAYKKRQDQIEELIIAGQGGDEDE